MSKGLICLYGSLGSGKTTFVRGFAAGLGFKQRIQSPTFTFERVYENKKTILYHFDFYRLSSKPDLSLIANVEEVIQKNDGFVIIEWAEKISDFLPKTRTEIHFKYIDDLERKLIISQ